MQSNHEYKFLPIAPDLDQMINASAIFLSLALKFTKMPSPIDFIIIKSNIRRFLLQQPDQYKLYNELIERNMMANEFIRLYGQLPGHITQWFTSTTGFNLTADWYAKVLKKRQEDPLYRLELKALAEAMLEFYCKPCEEIRLYWLKWLKDRKAKNEHRIFTQFIQHIIFNHENN